MIRSAVEHPNEFIRASRLLCLAEAKTWALINEARLTSQLLAFAIEDRLVPPWMTEEELVMLCRAKWFKRRIAGRYMRVQVVGEWIQNLARDPYFGNHDSDDWASP